MADDRKILYRFVQNDTNFMLLTQSEFKGKDYWDVRKYFVNEQGKEIATKKGLMLSAEEWFKVITILQDFINFVGSEQSQKETPEQVDNTSKEPDTNVFDYKTLDDITLNDNPFVEDGDFPW